MAEIESSIQAKTAPDIFVIGAMRAGTTLFYDLLKDIPGISVARMKETDAYLTDEQAQSAPELNTKQYGAPSDIWVDISPNYTKRQYFPGVPERIRQANPDARFIFFARDPLKRAISGYTHAALVQGEPVDPERFFEEKAGKASIQGSSYAWQIQPYLDVFPRDRFLFIEFEKFCKSPAVYAEIISQHIGSPQRLPLPESLDRKANAAEDLGALPGWFGKFRNSPLGVWLRQNAQRGTIDRAKRILTFGRRNREAPELPQSVKDRLVSMLIEDTRQFRKLSGIEGESWSIPV